MSNNSNKAEIVAINPNGSKALAEEKAATYVAKGARSVYRNVAKEAEKKGKGLARKHLFNRFAKMDAGEFLAFVESTPEVSEIPEGTTVQ